MRVAFAGASGVGKTTLAAFVAETYGVPCCPVGSRSVAASMGFASPYDVDAAGKRAEFQRRLFEQKRAWEALHPSFVTDRTHLDNLAYRALSGACVEFGTGDVGEYLLSLSAYDAVVYVPLSCGQWLGDDPARKRAEGYHLLFDALLLALLRECGGYFETLRARSVAGRQRWLLDYLGPPPERGPASPSSPGSGVR